MEIHSIVIHEIIKNENTTSENVSERLSLNETTIDDKTNQLLTSLNDSFNKRSPTRGKLSDDGFKRTITDFNNIDLIENSKTLTTRLKEQIQNITLAKGGYLLFCKYTVNNRFLSVFLLRNTNGAIFENNSDIFEIKDTQHIDIEKFAMGVRINLDLLNDDSDKRYVQLSRGKTDISQYFENWIGLTDTRQENKDAQALYDLTAKLPIEVEGINTRDDLRKKIYEFAKNSTNNRVNINELSSYLYGDENLINEHITNDIDIDGEFSLRGKNLSKFYKVSAVADGIDLSASRDVFSDSSLIDINNEDGTVIIHSIELVNKIKEQLD